MSYNHATKHMKGTEGGDYVVVAATDNGAVGFRQLDNGRVRVRVETEAELDLPGWKSPGDGQQRYSTVASDFEAAAIAIVQGVLALQQAQEEEVPDPPPATVPVFKGVTF